jgi:hypothetical protein
MDTHQARTEAIQKEIVAQMNAHQERMGASVNAWRNETTACQEKAKGSPEKMKAGLEETTERKHISYEHEC